MSFLPGPTLDSSNRATTVLPDIVVTGQTLSCSSTANVATIPGTSGYAILSLMVTGGTGTYTIEGTIDGTNWLLIPKQTSSLLWGYGFNVAPSTGNNTVWLIGGVATVRIHVAGTGSGSFTYSYVLTNDLNGLSSSYMPVTVGAWGTLQMAPALTGIGDGINAASSNAVFAGAVPLGYNGSTFDRIRKDAYANGPQWITSGGGSTAYVAAAAGTTVIKNSKGRLCKVQVTTLGATALTFYDHASAASGSIIGIIPASAAAGGAPITFDWPAANGITGDFLAGSPAVSISYW